LNKYWINNCSNASTSFFITTHYFSYIYNLSNYYIHMKVYFLYYNFITLRTTNQYFSFYRGFNAWTFFIWIFNTVQLCVLSIDYILLPIFLLSFSSYNSAFICHSLCSHYVVKNIHGSLECSLCIITAFNQLWVLCRCCLARNGIPTAMIDDHLALVHIIAKTAARLLPS